MKLTNDELKKLYWGALRFEETADGYLQGFQYTREQENYFKGVSDFWFERCTASTAKTLEFVTEAEAFSFEYRFIWKGSEDSVELWVDDVATDIRYVKDMEEEGSLKFALSKGTKRVLVYLPADATMQIRNFEIDAAYETVTKREKVLWIGDSITQGYGPLRSGHTYVSVANRLLNYDIINQGIGGYVYDPNVLVRMGDYQPDKIIIAMGTNQFGTESMEPVEKYYERLRTLYGSVPVLTILPLWRGDVENGEPTLISFCEKLRAICEKYENITVVDGFKLVPHLEEYFVDNLHPNCLGSEVYGRNLVLEIQKWHLKLQSNKMEAGELLMKTIKTDGIYYLSPIGNNTAWFWGMDHTCGDLDEAAALYKQGHLINKNRAVYVRYPDGILIEPVVAEPGQYLGVPSLYHNNRIYTLLVDFPKREIHLLSFEPEEILRGGRVETVAVLPLSIAEDCYNLLFKSSPVMLTRQSSDNIFQILWTEADGILDVEFPIGAQESFSHAEGDRLYFSSWWETEESAYEYHEETVVRNRSGEVLQRLEGDIFEIYPGEYWRLH